MFSSANRHREKEWECDFETVSTFENMKYYFILLVCCAAPIFAAPVKDDNEETHKIQLEVKPADLQFKVSPTKIEAKLVEPEIHIGTPTTSTTSTTSTPSTTTTTTTEAPKKLKKNEIKAVKSEAPAQKTDDKVLRKEICTFFSHFLSNI